MISLTNKACYYGSGEQRSRPSLLLPSIVTKVRDIHKATMVRVLQTERSTRGHWTVRFVSSLFSLSEVLNFCVHRFELNCLCNNIMLLLLTERLATSLSGRFSTSTIKGMLLLFLVSLIPPDLAQRKEAA
jgi:hypothetical protein